MLTRGSGALQILILLVLGSWTILRGQTGTVGCVLTNSDTTFSSVVPGAIDAFNTRKYSQETVFSAPYVVANGGVENNISLSLENNSSETIFNPIIEINGKAFLYSFADWVKEMHLDGLGAVDDTIRCVWNYFSTNLYHWTISSNETGWTINPLRTYNTFGSGLCHDVAQLVVSTLDYLGYRGARFTSIANGLHSIAHVVLHDGRDIPVDSDIKVLYTSRSDGRLVGMTELFNDQDLVARQHHYGLVMRERTADYGHSLLYSSLLRRDESNYMMIDSMNLRLRPHEKLIFTFNEKPGPYYNYYHFYYGPSHNEGPPPTAALGLQQYAPPFDYSIFEYLVDTSNISLKGSNGGAGLSIRDSSRPGTFTVEVSNPYAITNARIHFWVTKTDTTANLFLTFRKENRSEEANAYQLADDRMGSIEDSVDLYTQIQPIGTPATNRYFVRFESRDMRKDGITIDSIKVDTWFQFNPNAVPRLKVGENVIRVSSPDGRPLSGLSFEQKYVILSSSDVPPKIASLQFPADGAQVRGSQVEFRWALPSGWTLDQISDFHIQVSERSDFRFPVSSVFNKLVSQAGNGIVPNWKVPTSGILIPGKQYYWRVASRSKGGVFSDWSAASSFSIVAPGVVANAEVVQQADSIVINWQPNPVGSIPSKYMILADYNRGFSYSDSLVIDSVSVTHYAVKNHNRSLKFPFYRIIAEDSDGSSGGMSDIISTENIRLFVESTGLVNLGDSSVIRLIPIEPRDRYATQQGLEAEVVDSLRIQFQHIPAGFSINGSIVQGIVRNTADTIITVYGTSAVSNQTLSRTIPLQVNIPPLITTITDTIAYEDSLFSAQVLFADQTVGIPKYLLLNYCPWLSLDTISGRMVGTPRTKDLHETTLVVRVEDGLGGWSEKSFVVHVQHANHPPRLDVAQVLTINEDSLFRLQILPTDPDTLFGDTLKTYVVGGPGWLHMDSLRWVLSGRPNGQDVGDTSFTLGVSDGKGGSVTNNIRVSVRHINHPPSFTGQGISGPPPADTGSVVADPREFLLPAIEDSLYHTRIHANDPDSSLFGDRVYYRLSGPPTWLTLDSVSGTMSGTASGSHVRDTLIIVQAYDNKGGSTEQQFVIRVQHVNHIPWLLSSPVTSISEDSLYRYPIVAQDVDSDLWGDAIRYTLKVGPEWLGIDTVRGLLSGNPNGKDVGRYPVTLEVTDGKGGTATQSFTLNVNHTNHMPAFTSQPVQTATEDSLYLYKVYARDQDSLLFGDMTRYRMDSGPSWLKIDSLSGVLTGTPGRLDVHDTAIAIEANDRKGGRGVQNFQLRVIHVNHPPVISSRPAALAKEDSLYKYDLKATDDDAAQFGDHLRYRASVKPGWIAVDSVNGTVAGFPGAANVGDTIVTVQVCDQFGGVATQQFALKVLHTNHAPRLQRIPDIVFPEDSSATIHLDQFVSDADNSTKSLRWRVGLIGDETSSQKAQPGNAALKGTALKASATLARITIAARTSESRTDSLLISLDSVAHTVSLTSTKYFHGTNIPIGFTVSDSGGLSASTALLLTVTPVNHPPVLQKLAAGRFDEDDSLVVPFKTWYAYLSDPEDADSEHTWIVSGGHHIHVTQSPGEVKVRSDRDWFGTDSLRVVVADTSGLRDSTYWVVSIRPVNDAPRIASVPDTVAYADFFYQFRLVVKDPDDSLFTYRLSGPRWLSVDSTGRVSGRPDNPGRFRVSLDVQDSSHAADSVCFMLTVLPSDLAKDLSNGIPQVFVLKQNYPNPFNPATTIRFGLPERGRMTLDVFDILGQRVDRLVDGEIGAGYHEILWSPNVASGMYFLVMHGESSEHAGSEFRFVRKMMLLR